MRKYFFILSAVLSALVLSVSGAQAGTGGVPPPAGVVSSTPATGTPHFDATQDNPVEQIRQLVQCGGTMYAVGTFTAIVRGSTTYQRENVFSFRATAPFTVSAWAPNVVGTTTKSGGIVNSIAFVGGNCSDAYIGGHFTSVNGTSAQNIAEISTSTGNVVSTFGDNANGVVETLLGYSNHLLVGGYYTSINNSSADPYMTSLNPTTGADDGFVQLNISGNYQFPGVGSNPTRVYNQALSHGGTLDLVMGDFTQVGGLQREQIFMLNLATSPATVTAWTSPEWDGSNPAYPYECATVEPFYIQAAAWSPDDSTVYIGTTGYHPNGFPVGQTPRTGLCDAAAAFPSTQTSVLHKWVNYTGCDSLYAAAADANSAYFGGHERYSMNSKDCDALGSNGYNAPGMEGLQPTTGDLYVNSTNTAGYYTRGRGAGATDMLVTSAGLWIASDNLDGTASCGGKGNESGICFLPYSS